MPDRLHETLTTLRHDVDRTGLTDSEAIRRRGNQRTRRQAVGAALAVVLAVGGIVGVSAQLGGGDRSTLPPAQQTTSPGPTTSATTEPRPSQHSLTSDSLLAPVDLPVAEGVDTDWRTADADPNGPVTTDLCLMPYDGDAFASVLSARYSGEPGLVNGQAAAQWVYEMPPGGGVDAAGRVFAEVVDWVRACPEHRPAQLASTPKVWSDTDWSTGSRAQHYFEIALDVGRGDVGLVQRVAIGQVDDLVTVIVLEHYAQDGSDPQFTRPVLEGALDRLATAAAQERAARERTAG